jgi:hypothetical protein
MKRQPHYAEIADAISWNMERKRRMEQHDEVANAQQAFDDLRCRCDDLAELMVRRGMVTPSASARARSGEPDAYIILTYYTRPNSGAPLFEHVRGDTVELAFAAAEKWVRDQPTPEQRALTDALTLTAQAIEVCQAAGLDHSGYGATFVAELKDVMARLSKNALTDQTGARGGEND